MNKFQKALSVGLSVVPCNGKMPTVDWGHFCKLPATQEEASKWHGNIAVVCGKVSGGLVCIDFDEKNGECFNQWVHEVNEIAPELLTLIYIETTISGGFHVYYKSDTGTRNMKLAKNKTGEAMIETRGEGGLSVCAPSKGYKVYYGSFKGLPKLSKDEENILLGIAESFNQFKKEEYEFQPKSKVQEITGDTVLNRYDITANPVELLKKHGWKIAFSRANKVYLRRPGKKEGVSATWNVIPGRFYCFSSSTIFEVGSTYKPSAVYAMLEHDGDFKAACKYLAEIEKK